LSYEHLVSNRQAHSITQPIEKNSLVVSRKEEVVIIKRCHKRQQLQGPEEAVEGNVVNLQQITDTDKRMIDMQNNMEHHFRSIDSRLEKMERNIGRIAMIPFGSRQQTIQTTEVIRGIGSKAGTSFFLMFSVTKSKGSFCSLAGI